MAPQIVRKLIGGQWRTVEESPANGGSQPGGIYKVDVVFDEPAAAHADLTATVPVPAGATVLDVHLIALAAPWADAALFDMQDTLYPFQSYFASIDLKAGLSTTYDPTSPTPYTPNTTPPQPGMWLALANGGNTYQPNATSQSASNLTLNMTAQTAFNAQPMGVGVYYALADTLTLTVSGIATGGGGGKLLARVIMAAASTPVAAS